MIEQELITQMDTAVFSSIAIASQQTADNTTLGQYDYWTIIIAVFALIVAFATFMSQRQTEKNTRTISLDCQIKMLKELFMKTYMNFIRISALKYKWETLDYKGYPYDDFVCRMKLTLQYLNLESCVSLNENQYLKMLKLKQQLDEYNERLKVRFELFKNKDTHEDIKKIGLNSIERELALLLKIIIDVKKSLDKKSKDDFYIKCLSDIRAVETIIKEDSNQNQNQENENVCVPGSVKLIDIFVGSELLEFESCVKRCIEYYIGTDKRNVEYVKIVSNINL